MEFSRQTMKKLSFLLCFGIVLYWALYHPHDVMDAVIRVFAVFSPLIFGLCFAFVVNILLKAVENLWNRLLRKKQHVWLDKCRRPVCLIICITVILGVMLVLLVIIIPQLNRTVQSVVVMLPHYAQYLEEQWLKLTDLLAAQSIQLPQYDLDPNEIGRMAGQFLTASGQSVFNRTVDITTSIFSGVLNAVLGLVFAIYILLQKEKLCGQLKKLLYVFLPGEKVVAILDITDLINKTFTNFVTGQLMEAVIIGVLCWAGMSLFAMPYAAMISALVGFTALIPMFGAFIGTAVGVFLILTVDPVKAFWFIIFIIALQQIEGNLIYPRVMGQSIGLPGLWILVAVMVGGGAFGLWGMILGVPLAAVLYTLLRRAVQRRLDHTDADGYAG